MFSRICNLLIAVVLLPVFSTNALGAWADVDIKDLRAFTNQADHFVIVNDFSNPEQCDVQNTLVLIREDTSN